MHIASRHIGTAHAPYVIAELGVNHDGSPQRALELTDAAADAGAHAVKLQHFRAPLLMSRASTLATYQRDAGETDPIAMLARLELPLDAQAAVIDRAHARGLHAIVTVFSVELVPDAAGLPWDAFKTASPDIVHRPLLETLLETNRPIIVSTGASEPDEIARALSWLTPARNRLALLQCVSSYPAPEPCLTSMRHLRELLPEPCPVGYSDHTLDERTGAEAVALGASILERHLTHDRAAPGPDHAASLDPAGFARYVAHLPRVVPPIVPPIGPVQHEHDRKRVLPCELDVRRVSRQSIVAAHNIARGQTITRGMLTFKRPGTGLPPWQLDQVLSRRAARDIASDQPITADDLTDPACH